MSNVTLDRDQINRAIRTLIKATREDLDINQAEFARRLGLTPDQVADLEVGRRVIRAADLFITARALEIAPDAWVRRIERWIVEHSDASTRPPSAMRSVVEMTKSEKTDRERLERVIRTVLFASRTHLELSQREVAERVGWNHDQVAKIERGRRSVYLVDFLIIAKALNIDPMALLLRVLRW